MSLAIETEKLTKAYGRKARGIEDVDLAVEEGEVFGFLGPNGAGKTTTVRRVLGYAHELSERLGAELHRPMRRLSRGNKQKIGLVQAMFHRPPLLMLDEPTGGGPPPRRG